MLRYLPTRLIGHIAAPWDVVGGNTNLVLGISQQHVAILGAWQMLWVFFGITLLFKIFIKKKSKHKYQISRIEKRSNYFFSPFIF
jgi:hypothetical protein